MLRLWVYLYNCPFKLDKSGFPGGVSGKESACHYRRPKRHRFDPWDRRTPGGGHDDPSQYSCLENPMDRGDWQVTVHRVAKSQTRNKPYKLIVKQ